MTEDKLMRLSLVAKQIGVGTSTIVQKLSVHGYKVENNPNAKLNFEQLKIVAKEFGAGSLLQEYAPIQHKVAEEDVFVPVKRQDQDYMPLYSRNTQVEPVVENYYVDKTKLENDKKITQRILEFKRSGKNEGYLNLSNLGIEIIPEAIKRLTKLLKLNISHNKISTIENLPEQLIELDLSNNLIENFHFLPNLTSINLASNKLKVIPDISKITTLKGLYLYGNPIVGSERTLIGDNQGYNCINSLRNYFIELSIAKIPNRNIKLLLVGNSNVGKSSILRALKNEPYDEKIKSTHAISLDNLTVKDSDVKLQVWDLGGQEIYYGTHRFFMMSPCVQLVIFDADTESKSVSPDRLKDDEEVRNIKLPYYIKKIEEISPQSKIIILQSKFEQFADTPKHTREYFVKYDNLKISAKNNSMINTLRQLIAEVAETVSIYGQDVPYHWESVREYFINNFENDEPLKIIDKQKFREICIKKSVLPDGIDDLLRYLHNTGALYYQDEMQEDIIIDQIWALKVIYKVFDRENDFYKEMRAFSNGKCTIRTLFNDFDKLEDKYTSDEKWIFLRFMQSCGLCFSVKSNPEEILNLNHFLIFPEFLPSTIPSFVKLWNLKNTSKIIFKKKFEFLPYYPLHSVISKLGTKTSFNLLWRNGILIFLDEDNFNGFLIEANFENHTLIITVDADAENWVEALQQLLVIKGDTSKNEWIRQEETSLKSLAPVIIDRQLKSVDDLGKLEDVKQDILSDTVESRKMKKLVISYASENLEEVKFLVSFLKGQCYNPWYDVLLSNRSVWTDEIAEKFLNAEGYLVVISNDYMNTDKNYIHKEEIPIIIKGLEDSNKFCLLFNVGSFTLDPDIHQIAKCPKYKNGAVLPDIIKSKSEATKFMDELVIEIGKKF